VDSGHAPGDGNVIFAGSRFGYLYRSDDAGESWKKLQRGLNSRLCACEVGEDLPGLSRKLRSL
jgi:hypothetical protein